MNDSADVGTGISKRGQQYCTDSHDVYEDVYDNGRNFALCTSAGQVIGLELWSSA